MTIIIDGTVGANKAVVLDSSGKLPAIDGSLVTTLNATQVTTGTVATARIDTGTTTGKVLVLDGSGNMPAIAAGAMTGVESATKSASDPTISTNPSTGLGTKWINTTSGEIFILTDATAGENVWTSTGGTSGNVAPIDTDFNGDRGIFAGGSTSTSTQNSISYISIPTTANSVDFGDLSVARGHGGSGSNGTRGVMDGGMTGHAASLTVTNTMDYITIATTGNATDFGDRSGSYYGAGGCGNQVRALFAGAAYSGGGYTAINIIDYVTIATTGNTTDFGDLLSVGADVGGACNSVRAVFAGSCSPASNTIQYVTVATTGNAVDFGDMATTKGRGSGTCAESRALYPPASDCVSGGYVGVEYIADIMTLSNGAAFGNLGVGCSGNMNGNNTRAVAGVMSRSDNRMEYFTIASTGNATDFGDLPYNAIYGYAFSG